MNMHIFMNTFGKGSIESFRTVNCCGFLWCCFSVV